MGLRDLKKNWNEFGKTDPLWAILTDPTKKGNRWDEDEFFRTGLHEVERYLKYLDTIGVTVPRGRGLDFGCGVGRLTQGMAAYFEEVHGVDIAASMTERAEGFNRFGEKCIYHCNEKDDLGLFPDDSFDFILSVITLQHIRPEYAVRYLREFLRVLAPGGVALFQVPSELRPGHWFLRLKVAFRVYTPPAVLRTWRKARRLLSGARPFMEMYGIRPDEVRGVVESSGGTVIDIKENDNSGACWTSFSYCVTKEDPKPER